MPFKQTSDYSRFDAIQSMLSPYCHPPFHPTSATKLGSQLTYRAKSALKNAYWIEQTKALGIGFVTANRGSYAGTRFYEPNPLLLGCLLGSSGDRILCLCPISIRPCSPRSNYHAGTGFAKGNYICDPPSTSEIYHLWPTFFFLPSFRIATGGRTQKWLNESQWSKQMSPPSATGALWQMRISGLLLESFCSHSPPVQQAAQMS